MKKPDSYLRPIRSIESQLRRTRRKEGLVVHLVQLVHESQHKTRIAHYVSHLRRSYSQRSSSISGVSLVYANTSSNAFILLNCLFLETDYPLIEQVAVEMGWRVSKNENPLSEFDLYW